jgi:hypothetical protein
MRAQHLCTEYTSSTYSSTHMYAALLHLAARTHFAIRDIHITWTENIHLRAHTIVHGSPIMHKNEMVASSQVELTEISFLDSDGNTLSFDEGPTVSPGALFELPSVARHAPHLHAIPRVPLLPTPVTVARSFSLAGPAHASAHARNATQASPPPRATRTCSLTAALLLPEP